MQVWAAALNAMWMIVRLSLWAAWAALQLLTCHLHRFQKTPFSWARSMTVLRHCQTVWTLLCRRRWGYTQWRKHSATAPWIARNQIVFFLHLILLLNNAALTLSLIILLTINGTKKPALIEAMLMRPRIEPEMMQINLINISYKFCFTCS